ncbi:MAG: arsenate reductase [Gammaproteobacteria bacterium]|jgi:arsenate reductase
MIIYGIPNCDTVRKSRKWLTEYDVDHQFHDFRKNGLEETKLRGWCAELGWEALLNKRGTTWRQLPDKQKKKVDEEKAIALMLEHVAMIKRPVLETPRGIIVGFNNAHWQRTLIV